ncbi:MAG: DUF1232 domain-containing protein [Firmicutes bacterium]|nr:DUF1232 domain-containing protein [Bacillota bacterium]
MKSRKEYSERKLLKELDKNKDKAKEYLRDNDKMEKLFKRFEEKLKLIPKVGGELSNIAVLLSMIRAYALKQYTQVPLGTIVFGIAGIIYVVNPFDLIPDAIPVVGVLDDAAVLGLVLNALHSDLQDYRKWRAEQEKQRKEKQPQAAE